MSAKHTPGPWCVVEEPHPTMISTWAILMGNQSLSFFPYSYQYADAEKTCGGYVANHEVHANARLIAAAPELLEALQRIEKRIAYYASMADGDAPNIEQWAYTDQSGDMAIARAAIAKATGEQA